MPAPWSDAGALHKEITVNLLPDVVLLDAVPVPAGAIGAIELASVKIQHVEADRIDEAGDTGGDEAEQGGTEVGKVGVTGFSEAQDWRAGTVRGRNSAGVATLALGEAAI